ncbi:MAG TPA: N-acetylglucosamine-6-phosphate deacetylase [Acholeplasmataceae bacterium]|nr:N-acetylglucosamine-6-phosphate deacetylase [Acholeplasmataceae bacterium]
MNFKNINIVLRDKIINASLEVKDGKIASIDKTANLEGLEMKDYYLVPGFIDQHVHGAFNHDFMDGTKEALNGYSMAVLQEGITSFLGTTMTQSISNVEKAVHNLVGTASGANLLGVHLEGPFIGKVFNGAQPEEYIIKPDIELFKEINKFNNIKIVSMAPEEDDNFEFIKYLVKNNIKVSMAHTSATYDQAQGAILAGAHGFTHGYNAMSKLHHRDIGVVGMMLLDDNTYAEIIADGIHVSYPAIKLLFKNKGRDNIILITDSMRAKHLPDGISELGGQEVIVKNNEARLNDGSLAGSILKMNDGVRNLVNNVGISLVDAIYVAATTPAINIGATNKGFIEEGMDADLVVLDKEFNVVMTIVNGKIMYERGKN